jgi:hypothetical protein
LLFIVGLAYHQDDKIAFLVVKLRQIDAEIPPGKFGLMELVVEDLLLSKLRCKKGGDLRNEVSFFSGEGKGDAEAFGTHNG